MGEGTDLDRSLLQVETTTAALAQSRASEKHQLYKQIVFLQGLYMLIYAMKIGIFVLLSAIYVFEIARHNAFFHYIAMTSSLNYRFLSCDVHKKVEDGRITTIEDCTDNYFLAERVLFLPVLGFQLYVFTKFRNMRANVSQNLNKPEWRGQSAADQSYMSGLNNSRSLRRGRA